MEKIPAGRNYYNVEVFKGSTFADMLLKGRFDVYGEDGGLI
jgi:hypothetical protein